MKVPHGDVVVLDRLLLDDYGPCREPSVVCAGLGELSTALRKAWHPPASRPPLALLLQAKVPHIPGVRTMPHQYVCPFETRLKSVASYANIIAENLDCDSEIDNIKQCYMWYGWFR